MERQGNSKWNWKLVCCSFLMVLLGLMIVLNFVFVLFLMNVSLVGSWYYGTLWTDITGRIVILLICYYVGGVYGYFPFPERLRASWWREPCFLLRRLQSRMNVFLRFCLLGPLSCMANRILRRANTSERPLLRDGSEERFEDCPPGLSEDAAVCDQDMSGFPSEIPVTSRSSDKSFDNSPAVSASPLHRDGNEELDDCPPAIPGPSTTTAVDNRNTSERTLGPLDASQRLANFFMPFYGWSYCTVGDYTFQSLNNSFGNSSVVPASPLHRDKNEELDDCPPAIRGPSTTTAVDNQITSERTLGTPDVRQRSADSFMPFDRWSFCPAGGNIVPVISGNSDKLDASIPNSRWINDPARVSKDVVDDGKGLSESQKNHVATAGDHDRVVLLPTDETNTFTRIPYVGVSLPEYPRMTWKYLSPSGRIPDVAAKTHKINHQERKEAGKQIKKQNKALEEELNHLQRFAMLGEKESDGRCITNSDNLDPLGGSLPVRMISLPLKMKTPSPDGSQTTSDNFSRRCQLIPVHGRSASDRSHQSDVPKMCIKTTKTEETKSHEDFSNLQVMLDPVTTLMEFDRSSQSVVGVSKIRQNVCIDVEEPAG